MECRHTRIKKNYPHGKKSTPVMFCKDCGKVIHPKDIMKDPKRKRQVPRKPIKRKGKK